MLRLVVNESQEREEKNDDAAPTVLIVSAERSLPDLKLIAGGGRAVRDPSETSEEILTYGFSS